MLKQALALAGLTLSMSVSAAIFSTDSSYGLDTVTRDTATGLDWLDLTETNGRSYHDVSSKLGVGQEFGGWRYATVEEVQTLWMNFGVLNGTSSIFSVADTAQYNSFITAVTFLGNTQNEYDAQSDYGTLGFTADAPQSPAGNRNINGIYHVAGHGYVSRWGPDTFHEESLTEIYIGSYLVAPSAVPIPTAGWLFMSALVGLVGKKRLSRR